MKYKIKTHIKEANSDKQAVDNKVSSEGTQKTQNSPKPQLQTSQVESTACKHQSSSPPPQGFTINMQNLAQAFIYSEVLGKPKAKRRGRWQSWI